MVKLQIANINKWKYTLIDVQSHKTYNLDLEFQGLKKPLKAGDQIIMHKELLDPNYTEYSTNYIFGPLDQTYGREISSTADIDAIGIKQGDKVITFKRFYG